MIEQLPQNSENTENLDASSWDMRPPYQPRFPEDPNQYTEEELYEDPAKRFHVNPADFPIFGLQNLENKAISIDESLGFHVQATADTIAVLAGENNSKNGEKMSTADHVIYLDKSGRPVSWLVDAFWEDFTNKPRPSFSYIDINGSEWYHHVTGEEVDGSYTKGPDDTWKRLTPNDFDVDKVDIADIARIRARYIPDDTAMKSAEDIMNTPTTLDGKNITIVDEVSDSGFTIAVAKKLFERAIPEASSVNTHIYWQQPTIKSVNGERQMNNAPIWYKKNYGFDDMGENSPTRDFIREIEHMHNEWSAGHILMMHPKYYNRDAYRDYLKKQGIVLASAYGDEPRNSFLAIKNDMAKRRPK